jgi:hypothetical protein
MLPTILTGWGTRLSSWAERRAAWIVPAVLLVCLSFFLLFTASPLWYDEMLTLYISRLPTFGEMLRAMPADGHPPLQYLLARVALSLGIKAEIAVRLPSLLGFGAALLATYLFVRRRCGVPLALLAMGALATCGMASYAHEGRPYGLMLAFTGLTLVSWQAATQPGRPRALPLLGVALGIACAVASHHYGVFHVGIPLLCGETVRLLQRRRLDFPLYFACAAGLSMLIVTFPIARASGSQLIHFIRESSNFWAKPGIGSFRSYANAVSPLAIGLFALFWWLTRPAFAPASQPQPRPHSFPRHELAAVVGLFLMVPVMICATRLATGYYVGRYAIGSAMASAMLTAIVPYLWGRNTLRTAAVASLCLIPLALGFAAASAVALHYSTNVIESSLLQSAPEDPEPIVVASALGFVPDWWYASPRLRPRLHYLSDLPYAVHQPDFLPEASLVKDQDLLPCRTDDYRQFLATHSRFLLYSTGSKRLEWTMDRLRNEGWTLTLVTSRGVEKLYLAHAPAR